MRHPLPVTSLLLLANYGASYAQTSSPGIPTIIPPSPTAAALEKYGQTPVGTYTGVPDISVPLYTIQVRDLTIPLSLNYHAGGFRVGEEASWVGLGWSLMAGGAITRTVRNLDDLYHFIDHYGNYTAGPFNMPAPSIGQEETSVGNGFNAGNTNSGAMALLYNRQDIWVGTDGRPNGRTELVRNGQALSDPTMDWEPDDFRFTAGVHSGQFAFQQDGSVHLLEQQKVRIERPVTTNVWKISTPDGYQYFYGAAETTTSTSALSRLATVASAWYLTRVVSPLGEEATLSYEKGGDIQIQPTLTQTEVKQYNGYCDEAANTDYSGVFAAGYSSPQYLRRIDFRTGYVLFEREAARLDLNGAERLRQVSLYDKQNQLLKRYDLRASYFETPEGLQQGYATTYNLTTAFENKRLRLDAVQETGSDGATKPATKFAYSAVPLPAKSSYNVDYWGYSNGPKGNTSMIPAYSGSDLNGQFVHYPGADRTPDAAAMSACVLRAVTYPTGGSTRYTFEPHDYGNLTTEDDIVVVERPTVRLLDDNTLPAPTIPTTSFTVKTATPLEVRYSIRLLGASPDPNLKSATSVRLIDEATGRPFTSGSVGDPTYYRAVWTFPENTPALQTTGTATIVIQPGTYHLEAFRPSCSFSTDCRVIIDAHATYSVITRRQDSDAPNRLAGGLRVKRVEETDGLDSRRDRVWSYEYGARGVNSAGQGVARSAGVLFTRPVFKKVLNYDPGGINNLLCNSLQLTSYSNSYFSGGAKGSTVGYRQINVLQGERGEGGKTEYFFNCLEDRSQDYASRVSNVPTRSDDLNGYPTGSATYRWAADGYHLVSRTAQHYASPPDKYRYDLPAMHRGRSYRYEHWSGGITYLTKGYYYYYPIPVRWVRLQSTTTQTYDPADETKFVTATTRYTYDKLEVGHRQVSQTQTTRSDGSTLLTDIRYPADYTGVTTGALVAMRSDAVYQHAAPVETVTQVYGPGQTPAEARTVSGSYTEYVPAGGAGRYQPGATNALELAQPTPGLHATLSGSLPPAGRYRPQVQLSYEPGTGNLQQVQRPREAPTTYVWGYEGTLPVAKLDNASAAQTQDALAAIGWNPAVPAPETQLREALARLRQQLPQARLTGFTHRPLVGVSSQTDPSGRLTAYEYDGFQRLLRVRDEQGRILTQQQYRYAGP